MYFVRFRFLDSFIVFNKILEIFSKIFVAPVLDASSKADNLTSTPALINVSNSVTLSNVARGSSSSLPKAMQ